LQPGKERGKVLDRLKAGTRDKERLKRKWLRNETRHVTLRDGKNGRKVRTGGKVCFGTRTGKGENASYYQSEGKGYMSDLKDKSRI